jgi:hypothetical protein
LDNKIFFTILSVPHNIIMGLNNVMMLNLVKDVVQLHNIDN